MAETYERNRKYIPIDLTEPQRVFLSMPVRECLYGGAAGGGKSFSLLAGGLMYVHVPGYNAMIFRKNYIDLYQSRGLIEIANEWLKHTDARWVEKKSRWFFPSGASLGFGHLKDPNAKYKYQSAAFNYAAFDELTQFEMSSYTYIFSRCRKIEGFEVPIRVRGATNPGGRYGEWVYNRFLKVGVKGGHYFVPSTRRDNPYLNQDDYTESLAQLDYVTRAQLDDSDWEIKPSGNMFKRPWFRIVARDRIPTTFDKVVRFWDFAATEVEPQSKQEKRIKDPDYTCGAKVGKIGNQFFLLDIVRGRWSADGVEKVVQQTASRDGRAVEVWIEQEPGASGKSMVSNYARNILKGYAVRRLKPWADKVKRASPLSAAMERGSFLLASAQWNGDLIDEAELFPLVQHDDQIDAVSGAYQAATIPTGFSGDDFRKILKTNR